MGTTLEGIMGNFKDSDNLAVAEFETLQQHPTEPLQNPYTPPRGHDRELSDSERAHSGVPGMRVRHGADALGKVRVLPKQHHHADLEPRTDDMASIDARNKKDTKEFLKKDFFGFMRRGN